jgi:hypothetical protein
MIKSPKLRLLSFQNQQMASVIERKHMFCKLIGFEIDKEQNKCSLIKIEGIIFT